MTREDAHPPFADSTQNARARTAPPAAAAAKRPLRPGPSRTIPWHITASFGACLAAVVVLVLGFGAASQQQAASVQWVDHTWRVKRALDRLERQVSEAETSVRAYLLTSRDDLLAPYREAQQKYLATVDEIAQLTSDNPRQLANNAALKSLLNQKWRVLSDALAAKPAGGEADKVTPALLDSTLGAMARVRSILRSMDDEETKLLEQREAAFRAATAREQTTVVGASVAALLLICLLYATILRALKHRAHVEDELARVNRNLSDQVVERTTQLSALSQHLLSMSEKERDELARELHDELGSHLSAALMDVTAVARELKRAGRAELLPAIERAIETLRASTRIGRNIVADLRPIMLREFGLAQTIDAMCAHFAQASGIACEHRLEDLAFTEEAAIALYRIAQESLSNVRRHSQATRVHVRLSRVDETIELVVDDDGVGMRGMPARTIDAHGILGMRERALALGGTFDIKRGTGSRGTMVRVGVPAAVALKGGSPRT